jgi:hypothetical protein
MQPPQALAPIPNVLDLDAQVRAFAVILQRVHDEARVKVVGRYPVHKGFAHANGPDSPDFTHFKSLSLAPA